MKHSYDHFAFQVSDMDQSIRFYVEKLGFTLHSKNINAEQQEAYTFLSLGDLRLELIQDLSHSHFPKPEIKPPYCPHLAIETDDMQVTLAFLRKNRVEILRGPLEVPGKETWCYFCDPDNNVLEYIQWFQKK
jgi:catechol 2,3-dioxygenase-like lactoylglutathione lyase family enzyme